MFYLLLCSVLLIFIFLNRQAKNLISSQKKHNFVVILAGLFIITGLVRSLFITAVWNLKENGGYYDKFTKNKMYRVPARLFDPTGWKEFELYEIPSPHLSYKYDKVDHLVLVINDYNYMSFIQKNGQRLQTIFENAWVNTGYNEKFPYLQFHSELGYNNKLFKSPYLHIANGKGCRVDPKKIKSSVSDFYTYNDQMTPIRLSDSMNRIITVSIPYKKGEKMVNVGVEKLLTVVHPLYTNKLKNNYISYYYDNEKLMKSIQLRSVFPITFFPVQAEIFTAVVLLVLLALLLKNMKYAIVLVVLLLTVTEKRFDSYNSNQPEFVLKNRYSLPKNRTAIRQKIKKHSSLSSRFDELHWCLRYSEIRKFIPAYQLAFNNNGGITTLNFRDGKDFITVYLNSDQVSIYSRNRGGSFIGQHLQRLISELVINDRQANKNRKSYLFDYRHMSLKPLSEKPKAGEEFEIFLARELITFFAENAAEERKAVEKNNEK